MKTPKLYIQYSWIYDDTLHDLCKKKLTSKMQKWMEKYASKANKHWQQKYNNKVFKLMSQVSGLRWQRTEMDAYVARQIIPFSIPLTLHPVKNLDELAETIIHELCHNLIVQNSGKIQPLYKKLFREFKNEPFTTKIHLLVYAIHIPVIQKLFSKKKVKQFLEATKEYKCSKAYWRAVQIVQEKTPEYFLKMLK